MEGGETGSSGTSMGASSGAAQSVVFESESIAGEQTIQPETDVMDTQSGNETFDEEIMEIPGSSHDKLTALSQMEENSDEANDESGSENPNTEEPEIKEEAKGEKTEGKSNINEKGKSVSEKQIEPEESIEQKIMLLQAEALSLLAKSIDGKIDSKQNQELIKKLKELLEKLGKEDEEKKGSKKENLLFAVLGIIEVVVKITEKGLGEIEKEVKEN
jgi:hypothetical protein